MSRASYISLLRRCTRSRALDEGRRIHEEISRSELCVDAFLGVLLIDMYGKCGSVEQAERVFQELPSRNVVSWTSMIAAYTHNGHPERALDLYRRMDVEPDGFVFTTVLSACADLRALAVGKQIHSRIMASSSSVSNIIVQNALLNMYSKCGDLHLARQVFDSMLQRDVISWTTIISAYAQYGYSRAALSLYYAMDLEGARPNSATFASVLTACSTLKDLKQGRAAHLRAAAEGLDSGITVETAIVDMYAKCGSLEDAARVFQRSEEKMNSHRNVGLWNAMITAYAQRGHHQEAIDLYHKMEFCGIQSTPITFASVLCACSDAGDLQTGKKIHSCIIARQQAEEDCRHDLVVENALIHMYAKCGKLKDAEGVFVKMSSKDVVSWTGLIAGYAQQGHASEALTNFQLMNLEGVEPDQITFTSILISCTHAGLLKEGRMCFLWMLGDYHIVPISEHYVCMIDLLGRSGRVAEARDLIEGMPFLPDVTAWTMLLTASKTHGDFESGKVAVNKAVDLDPDRTSPFLLMSGICSTTGRETDGVDIRACMFSRGLKKEPGQSYVEAG